MPIIGLTGYKGSGKSEVARILERQGYARLRFAGAVKDMLRVLGLDDDELDGNLKEVPNPILGGKTPRHAMQTLGTEWGRVMISDDLWTRVIERRLFEARAGELFVIDDVRFQNEAAMIRRMVGVIWRVYRAHFNTLSTHISELGIADLGHDTFLVNDGTLDDLARRTLVLLSLPTPKENAT